MNKKLILKKLFINILRKTFFACSCIVSIFTPKLHGELQRHFRDASEALQYFHGKIDSHNFRIRLHEKLGSEKLDYSGKIVFSPPWGRKFLELHEAMRRLMERVLPLCNSEFLSSPRYQQICDEYDRLENELEEIRQSRSDINEAQLLKLYELCDGVYGQEDGFLRCQPGFYKNGFDTLTAMAESLSLAEHLIEAATRPLEIPEEQRIFREEDFRVVAQRLADAVRTSPGLMAQLITFGGALRYLQEEAHIEYPEEILRAILLELGLE